MSNLAEIEMQSKMMPHRKRCALGAVVRSQMKLCCSKQQLLQQTHFTFGKQTQIYPGADMEIDTRAKHLKKKRALLKSSITQYILDQSQNSQGLVSSGVMSRPTRSLQLQNSADISAEFLQILNEYRCCL